MSKNGCPPPLWRVVKEDEAGEEGNGNGVEATTDVEDAEE
jgi:hypothetical protein